jgi:vacuolar protein sorting-associated protein 16
MEVPHPTAGWEQVGERFYRKTQLYTEVFAQDVDLDNYIVAGAPYAGAIGTLILALSLGMRPNCCP